MIAFGKVYFDLFCRLCQRCVDRRSSACGRALFRGVVLRCYRISDVAERLDVPIGVVERLIATGELVAATVGKRRIVAERELVAYVDRSAVACVLGRRRFEESSCLPFGSRFESALFVVWPESDGHIVVSDATGAHRRIEVIS